MVDEDPEHTFKMAQVHNQQPVEALGASGADEALPRSRSPSARAPVCG